MEQPRRGWEDGRVPEHPRPTGPPTQALFHPTAMWSSGFCQTGPPITSSQYNTQTTKATSRLQALRTLVSQSHVTGYILHPSLNPAAFSATASEPLGFADTAHDHRGATALRWAPKSKRVARFAGLTLQTVI